jgi:hypothetical protein
MPKNNLRTPVSCGSIFLLTTHPISANSRKCIKAVCNILLFLPHPFIPTYHIVPINLFCGLVTDGKFHERRSSLWLIYHTLLFYYEKNENMHLCLLKEINYPLIISSSLFFFRHLLFSLFYSDELIKVNAVERAPARIKKYQEVSAAFEIYTCVCLGCAKQRTSSPLSACGRTCSSCESAQINWRSRVSPECR